MDIQEQIYTSAAELLDSVSSNLGVIAQTRGFPKVVESDLVAHRSYTLRSQDIERGACPPRFAASTCGPHKSNMIVSRVSFAGADHTGRTRPFAHHLATRCQEMHAEGISPAAVVALARRRLRAEWEGGPAWLDAQPFAHNHDAAFPSSAWAALVPPAHVASCVASIADALLAAPASRQPVVVCIPPHSAAAVIDMMADILTLVPASLQFGCVCVSHVVDVGDNLRDATLSFTYTDTPFVTRCRERRDARRPIVFDLTRADTVPREPIGPYAQALVTSANGDDYRQMTAVVGDWDKWGFTPQHTQSFGRALRLRKRVTVAQPDTEIPDLAAEVAELANVPLLHAQLDEWGTELLRKSLLTRCDAARWLAIARFGCDGRWPAGARALAFDELAKYSADSLAPLFSNGLSAELAIDVITRALVERLPGNPSLTIHAVRLARQQSSGPRIHLASAFMKHANAPFEAVLAWWDDIAASSLEVQRALHQSLVAQLVRTARSTKEIGLMRERAAPARPTAAFNQDVYFHVLRAHFNGASSEETRRKLAELLMVVALRSRSAGTAGHELRELLKTRKSGITPQQVEAWLQQGRGTCQEAELQLAAAENGLIGASPPETPVQRVGVAAKPIAVQIAPLQASHRPEPTIPMRVGRNWAVLPPWAVHLLAIVIIVIAVGLEAAHFIPRRIPVPRLLRPLILAAIALVLWLTSVFVNQLAAGNQDRLTLAFAVRWVVAIALIALLTIELLMLWPVVSRLWPW